MASDSRTLSSLRSHIIIPLPPFWWQGGNVLFDPDTKKFRLIDWGFGEYYRPGHRIAKWPGTRYYKVSFTVAVMGVVFMTLVSLLINRFVINHQTRALNPALRSCLPPLSLPPSLPFWQSPELFLHYEYYDYAVDMWAVGCMLGAIIFKISVLFRGENNSQVCTRLRAGGRGQRGGVGVGFGGRKGGGG